MSVAARRSHPLRPIFLVSLLLATLLLLAYGWIENRWATAGFYLAIVALAAVFLTPPIWSYTRVTALDETPEADSEDMEGE
jgi:hypothetical protein